MRSAAIIPLALLLAAIAAPGHAAAPAADARKTEQQYLGAVREHVKRRDADAAGKEAAEFFRHYPESPLIPDVRLELAEAEDSPDESIARYRVIVDKYRYYKKRHYALLRICEIEYLLARWKELVNDARAGIGLAAPGRASVFRFYLVISLVQLGEYETAEKECRALIDADHDYNNMARSLLILAHIHRNTTGLSREYIDTVRELAAGYDRSDALPATLYLLGEFYEKKGMYNEAFSAYSDLSGRFPGSPEAAMARKRTGGIMEHTPRRVPYLPDRNILENAETIDIHPEAEVPDDTGDDSFYSIAVGPFPTAARANGIRALLKNFGFMKTVRLKNGYSLYVGRGPDEGSAMKVKMRLAEEYGLNGRIVRISGDGQRSYIYGE